MKATNKCFLIFILLILFAVYVIWDERKTLFNLRFNKIKEALQNYEQPIVDYSSFLDYIKGDEYDGITGNFISEYGGTSKQAEFSNTMSYKPEEVEQDIKYFNNASTILFGLKLAEENYE